MKEGHYVDQFYLPNLSLGSNSPTCILYGEWMYITGREVSGFFIYISSWGCNPSQEIFKTRTETLRGWFASFAYIKKNGGREGIIDKIYGKVLN